MPSSTKNLADTLVLVAQKTEESIKKFIGYSNVTKDATINTEKYEDSIESLINKMEKQRQSMSNAITIYKNIQKSLNEGVRNVKDLNKAYEDEINTLVKLTLQEKENDKIRKMINDTISKQTRTMGDYVDIVKKQKDIIGSVLGTAMSYGKVFGAQSITLQSIKDKVLGYNDSLYKLQRTQVTAGSGTKDLNKALDLARNSTYMSQNQVLDFANSFNKLYVGIKPSTTEIVKLASAIQQEFGTSAEEAMVVMNDLMGVQQKWPSLYDSIILANQRMVKGLSQGDAELISSSKELGAANISRLIAMNASADVIEKVIRLQDAQGSGMDDLAQFNKDMAKSSQKSNDLILGVGQSAENAMAAGSRAAGEFSGWLQGIPALAMTATAAIGAMNLVSINNIKSIIELISKNKLGIDIASKAGNISNVSNISRGFVSPAAIASSGAPTAARGAISAAQVISGGAASAAASTSGITGAASTATIGAGAGIAAGAILASLAGGAAIGHIIDRSFGYFRKDKKNLSTIFGDKGAKIFGPSISSTDTMDKHTRSMRVSRQMKEKMTGPELEIFETQEKITKAASRSALEYTKIKAEAKALLEIDQASLDALNKQLSVQEEFGMITSAILDKKREAAKFAFEDAKMERDNLKNLAPVIQAGLSKEIRAKINITWDQNKPEELGEKIREALKMELDILPKKQLEEVARYNKEILDIKSKITDETGNLISETEKQKSLNEAEKKHEENRFINESKIVTLKAQQKTYNDVISTYVSTQAQDSKTIIERSYKQIDQQIKYNKMIEGTLNLQRQLIESGQFGMGASVEMMQKQVDLAYKNVDALKKGDEEFRKQFASGNKLKEALLDQLDNAKDRGEQEEIIRKIVNQEVSEGKDKTKSEQEVQGYLEKHHGTQQAILGEQIKINTLTKEVREGYLSAIKQMAVGSSSFSKIIGTQTRGATQLMDITKRITGGYELNTQVMGGQVVSGTDLGRKPLYAGSVTGGINPQYSGAEQNKFETNRNYYDANKGLKNAGTALVSPDQASVSALKAAGVLGNVSGEVKPGNLPSTIPTQSEIEKKQRELNLGNAIKPIAEKYSGVNEAVLGPAVSGSSGNPPITVNPPLSASGNTQDELIRTMGSIWEVLRGIRDNGIPVDVKNWV